MAIVNPSDVPPLLHPIGVKPGQKPPRKWLRYLVYAVLIVFGLFVALVILGMLVGKRKSDDITAVLRRVDTDPAARNDPAFAGAAGITGKFHEIGPEAPRPPLGLKGNFYWSLRPGGADAEITTFDTTEHAAAAFELFKGSDPSSLLVAPENTSASEVTTTAYQEFSRGNIHSLVTKVFRCAQREHTYSCGSIVAAAPAIVTIRLALEADWHRSPSDDANEDPFAGLERLSAKTDRMAKEVHDVEETLQRLGVGSPKTK
jgi:hypothetical protein